MSLTRTDLIADPQGGRNLIRAGDAVKVRPAPGADKQSFLARFKYGEVDEFGRLVQATVIGGRGFNPAKPPTEQDAVVEIRTVFPHRIVRVSQAHIDRKRKAS